MSKTTIWDEKKLKLLKSLWDSGLPITKIGNELGVSRNAIAGKAHRLGLPKRNSPILSSTDEVSEKEKMIFDNEDDLPLKLSLRNVMWSRIKCCWPIGDPKLPGFKFCGKEIMSGRPYCQEHSYQAYTNARES